ncbi:unnamed protein product [Phytophthora fragariaefolia]|uniref:Unnamed protein product n=1 Tax=Phytophthora fragariaefolia TaxID=1490495 RepID=A0A9W7CY44_9STRA|nr:unnamed protein product [Phytophthora fragariaefolia]
MDPGQGRPRKEDHTLKDDFADFREGATPHSAKNETVVGGTEKIDTDAEEIPRYGPSEKKESGGNGRRSNIQSGAGFLGLDARPRSSSREERHNLKTQALTDIFSFRTRVMTIWVVEWGNDQDDEIWDQVQELTQEIWEVCCAATVTATWLWNVSTIHPDGQGETSAKEVTEQHSATLMATISRYGVGLVFLITRKSKRKIDILGGNVGSDDGAKAKSTTNNVAEFVGLHRLLTKAVEAKWDNMPIIGDSAMVIRMMKEREMPRHKKMQHWYRLTRKLADKCRVASWSHRYRAHNKTADWSANAAMDSRTSYMVTLADVTDVTEQNYIRRGVEEHIKGCVRRWKEEYQGAVLRSGG